MDLMQREKNQSPLQRPSHQILFIQSYLRELNHLWPSITTVLTGAGTLRHEGMKRLAYTQAKVKKVTNLNPGQLDHAVRQIQTERVLKDIILEGSIE